MFRPVPVVWIALGLGVTIFASAAQSLPQRNLLALIGFAMFLVGGLMVFRDRLLKGRRSRDPYSLESLRRFEEEQTFREAEEMAIDDDAEIICPHCSNAYDPKYPVCPRCRR